MLTPKADYSVGYQLKTTSNAEKLDWCVNPIITLTNPIAQNEYYVVDISGLKDVCGFGLTKLFTMPMPNMIIYLPKLKPHLTTIFHSLANLRIAPNL